MIKPQSISILPAALAVALMICLGAAACGKGDPGVTGAGGTGAGGGGGTGDLSQQMLPLKTGNMWTYLVTDENQVPTPKTQTVMEAGPVGGIGPHACAPAFRMVTRKGANAMDETISWQARVGTTVVRYREQAFSASTGDLEPEEHWDPFKLRVDETPAHTTAAATWVQTDQETKMPVEGTTTTTTVEERWTVAAERQPVSVQGKNYEVLIVTKTKPADPTATKTYWWARGIGKVKEIGVNQIEELMSYTINP